MNRTTSTTVAATIAAAAWIGAAGAQRAAAQSTPDKTPRAHDRIRLASPDEQRQRGTVGVPGDGVVLVARAPGASDKLTYLGLDASPAPSALQKQLKLPAGVGLIVDGVDDDGPAERAGVKELDVLHKLDDQLLVNPDQFRALVGTTPPGTEVKLTVLREGKPLVLSAKLSDRDCEPGDIVFSAKEMNFEWSDKGGFITIGGDGGGAHVLAGNVIFDASPRVTIENDRHRMTLERHEGRKRLRVEGKDGDLVFAGPLNTKADLDKIPPNLREAVPELLLGYLNATEAHGGAVFMESPVPPTPPVAPVPPVPPVPPVAPTPPAPSREP